MVKKTGIPNFKKCNKNIFVVSVALSVKPLTPIPYF